MSLEGLNPDKIRVTQHALQRYLERRGQRPVPRNYEHAEKKLRELLWRAKERADERGTEPAVLPSDIPGRDPVRRLTINGFCILVEADYDSVITFFKKERLSNRATQPKGEIAHGKRYRRPKIDDPDEGDPYVDHRVWG